MVASFFVCDKFDRLNQIRIVNFLGALRQSVSRFVQEFYKIMTQIMTQILSANL